MTPKPSWHRLWALLAVLSLTARATPLRVVVTIGLTDTEATVWEGRLSVSAGRLLSVKQWHGGTERDFGPTGTFSVKTQPDVRKQAAKPKPAKLLVTVDAPEGAVLNLATGDRTATQDLSRLPFGRGVRALDRAVTFEAVPTTQVVSGDTDVPGEDDYPSACVDTKGTVWVVWQQYRDGSDRIIWNRRDVDAPWGVPAAVPGTDGDLAHAACAVTSEGELVVVWSRQFEDGWDLEWARRKGNGQWSRVERLTRTPGSDLDLRAGSLADGRVVLVWQGFVDDNFEVMMKTYAGGTWSASVNLSRDRANDWRPCLAVGPGSSFAVAWDSYRNGSYDVFALVFGLNGAGPLQTVAASPTFEANVSAAWGTDGRLWFAWEEGTEGWGKDQGAVVPSPKPGTGLYRRRVARVRVLEGDRWLAPAKQPRDAKGIELRGHVEKPRLCVGMDGGVYLTARTVHQQVKRRKSSHGRFTVSRTWEVGVTACSADGWTRLIPLPGHYARNDSLASPVADPKGGITVVFHSDERTYGSIRQMVRNRVFAARIPALSVDPPQLAPEAVAPPHPAWRPGEAADAPRAGPANGHQRSPAPTRPRRHSSPHRDLMGRQRGRFGH